MMSGILTLTSIVLNVCCSVTCVVIIILLVNKLRFTGSESIKDETGDTVQDKVQDTTATSNTVPVEKTNAVHQAFFNRCVKCHAFVSIGGTCSRCGTVNIKK